jgi:TRAP-type C4-dicarboxylate transport system substrate-binding protein
MSEARLRTGGYQGGASVHTQAMKVLLGELSATGGFRPELTENVTALGREATDLFPMVEGGELEICYFASSYLASRVPNLAALDLPFRFSDRNALAVALDGPFGQALARDIAARTGFEVLAYWDNGFRHLTNCRHPIAGPADCRGLSIRTMDSALHQGIFRAMGFEPRYIDVKDYPAAVRSGAVDAQENPLTNIVNFGVPKTHKFLTLSGHLCGVTLVLANALWVAGLPSSQRRCLKAAMSQATEVQRALAKEEDDRCLQAILAAGVAVLGPDRFDRAAFVAATQHVGREAAARLDPALAALLD